MILKKELSQEAIKAHDDRQKELAALITDNLSECEKQRETKRASSQAIKDAETVIATSQQEIADANAVIRGKTDEIHLAEREIEEIKIDIATHEYNTKYNKILQEQTPFWTAATARLKKIQAELKEDLPDFADFVEAEEAMTRLQDTLESSPFTQFAVEIKTVAGNYERLLIDLVVDKLEGKKIRLARHQERNNLLDRFLKSDAIEKQWNRG